MMRKSLMAFVKMLCVVLGLAFAILGRGYFTNALAAGDATPLPTEQPDLKQDNEDTG